VAPWQARQFIPFGRADYFRIGDPPMILFQVDPFGSLISPLVVTEKSANKHIQQDAGRGG
jgi:hypothetical protein